MFFYATDFADRLEREILPALRAGFIMLTDRYIYSIIARALVRGTDRVDIANARLEFECGAVANLSASRVSHAPARWMNVWSRDGFAGIDFAARTATLVNTARLGVIDEDGLMKMFAERDDFVYLSDISPSCKEDIVSNYDDKRYFFTPKKMGAQTAEANINAGVAAANQIVRFFNEGDVTFKVN